MAVNAVGTITVPVNFRLTAEEINYILADSGATMVITDAELVDVADAARAAVDEAIGCVASGLGNEARRHQPATRTSSRQRRSLWRRCRLTGTRPP